MLLTIYSIKRATVQSLSIAGPAKNSGGFGIELYAVTGGLTVAERAVGVCWIECITDMIVIIAHSIRQRVLCIVGRINILLHSAQRISPGTTNRCLSITLIHECIVLTLLDSLVPGKNHLRRLSSCLNLARNPLRVHRNAWENNATEG